MNIQYASSLVFSQITDTDYEETFVIGEGGKVTLCLYGVLTRDIRISPTICLAGASASCQVVGLFLVRQGSVSIHTLQDHQAGNTKSDLLIKCVVDGQSSVSYEGSIRVNKDAQGTDAYQRNENLLLSKTAAAVSKPALEILANDVRCTHGAVVKPVDATELWYLNSRGISSQVATHMIVAGFLRSACDRVVDAMEREEVYKRCEEVLV